VINNTYSVTELRNKVNYLRTITMRFTEIISEDANPKRQAAIAIAMKKAGKKPKNMAEGESTILSPGTEVTVPHKGKMVPGKIVRYDSGKGIESPAYIVDISEYESLIVPVSRVKQDMDEGENWSKHNNPRAGGMSKKSVSSYRRSHPGSKIQTAVTTKPSKLKKGSKAAKRRASFCARMRGMKKHRTGAKTAHDPNSNINKSLRRWHCESIEELHELVMLAEQYIRNNKK